MSLLTTLVAVGIGGVVVGAIALTLTNAMQRSSILIRDADRREIRLYLAMATNCSLTKARTKVCNQTSIPLIDDDNKELVPVAGRKFDKFKVRGACQTGKLVVEYSRSNGSWEKLYSDKAPFTCVY